MSSLVSVGRQQEGRVLLLKKTSLRSRRNERGQYKVYNMTLQGGHPLTQAVLMIGWMVDCCS